MNIKNKLKNSNFSIKTLLTTASAFAVISSAASDAAADRYRTFDVNTDVTLINDQNVTNDTVRNGAKGAGVFAGQWKGVDSFFWSNDRVALTLGRAAAGGAAPERGDAAVLDLNGKRDTRATNPSANKNIQITVAHDSSIGSLINSGTYNVRKNYKADIKNYKADINVNDGAELHLLGQAEVNGVIKTGQNASGNNVDFGDYSALNQVTLGNNAEFLIDNKADLNLEKIAGANGSTKLQNEAKLEVKTVEGLLEISDKSRAIIFDSANNVKLQNSSNFVVKDITGLLEISDKAVAIISGSAKKIALKSTDAEVRFTGNGSKNVGEVVADSDGYGNVRVFANDRTFAKIGEQGKKLKLVEFKGKDSIVTKDLYAQTVKVKDDVYLGGFIEVDDFQINNNKNLYILDGATLDTQIKTDANNKASVKFTGSAQINQNLGEDTKRLKSVDMSVKAIGGKGALLPANPKITLAADIYAKDVKVKGTSLELAKDVKISGETEIENVKLDFGSHRLTQNGNIKIKGNNEVRFDVTGAGGTASGGNLVVNGNLEFEAGSRVILRPNVNVGGSGSHEFTLLNANNVNYNNVAISVAAGPFQKWTVQKSNQGVKFVLKDNSNQAFKKHSKGSEAQKNRILNSAHADAVKYKECILEIFKKEEKGELAVGTGIEAEKRIEKAGDAVILAQVIAAGQDAMVDAGLSSRVMGARAPMPVVGAPSMRTKATANSGYTGVASGDEGTKYGAWVNPFYGTVAQKARGEASGYNSYSYGASFGFDSKISEDSTIGIALSVSNSHTKHKDSKKGDKTKVSSVMLSVYNVHELTDKWFVVGTATVAKNRVHNYSKRVTTTAGVYDTAEGAYNMSSVTAKGMFGYSHSTDSAMITPMFGLKASRKNAVKYQETGAAQNLFVTTKAANKLELVAGMSVIGAGHNVNDMVLTPEIHAFANYDLFNKTQRSLAKLGDVDYSSANKVARMNYNVGLGLKSEYKAFEYGATYDLELANKRVGHQGAFKVRVNF